MFSGGNRRRGGGGGAPGGSAARGNRRATPPPVSSSSSQRSGGGGNNMTAAERAVLERQRQIAARLSGVGGGGGGGGGTDHPPHPAATGGATAINGGGGADTAAAAAAPQSVQQRQLMRARQRKALEEKLKPTARVARPAPSSSSGGGASGGGGGGGGRAAVIDLVDYDDANANTGSRKRPAPSAGAAQHKRPGAKRPPPRGTTPEEAVAAARARLGGVGTFPAPAPATKPPGAGASAPSSSSSNDDRKRSSTSSTSTGSGGVGGGAKKNRLLASLTASTGVNPNVRHYPTVHPDDYWRDVRRWNFVRDLTQTLDSQRSGGGGGKRKDKKDGGGDDGNDSSILPKSPQPIPDRFESYGEYVSKWAPLCLNENRAQLMSEFISSRLPKLTDDRNSSSSWDRMNLIVAVSVEPLRKDVGGAGGNGGGEAITVMLRELKSPSSSSSTYSLYDRGGGGDGVIGGGGGGGGGGRGGEFRPNDVVLLVRDPDDVLDLQRGGGNNSGLPRQQQKARRTSSSLLSPSLLEWRGIVGNVETFRRSLDGGLHVKVSRRIWTEHFAAGSGGEAPIVVTTTGRGNKGGGGRGGGGGGGATTPAVEMYLVRVGSNVTALREFTALCKAKHIPLLKYLLDGSLVPRSNSGRKPGPSASAGKDADVASVGSTKRGRAGPVVGDGMSKSDLLAEMGGTAALGKGFAAYAERRFNTSQLAAISAAAREYGDGGFTLVKGPPGTGKTTTLVALINSLHIRQFNLYHEKVRQIATAHDTTGGSSSKLNEALKSKPRILVCAPSNAAVDNIILKIIEDGFMDGNGCRYNPTMIRVGSGQSERVKDVSLEEKVDHELAKGDDLAKLQNMIAAHKVDLRALQRDIVRFRKRVKAIEMAAPWQLSRDWEIRIDEATFDQNERVFFVNHKTKTTTYEIPAPPEPGETQFPATAMPEYRAHVGNIVRLVERFNKVTSSLERCNLLSGQSSSGRDGGMVQQQIETHILDSVHIVFTTLGTCGSRALEAASKFRVVVVDEAAQSVEPATISALELGSSHAILVGDPQQLPATIFSLSGRDTKYDRSLFQRLEEAGHSYHLLNTQYRMHPKISDFPRHIFYGGDLLDGPNVQHPEYGCPLRRKILTKFHAFQPLTVLDLDSAEERGGTSLRNMAEARLALHLYRSLDKETQGMVSRTKVAVITPYAQQVKALRDTFRSCFGQGYDESRVEINTVDSFQGREANIVIFSCVRAAGSKGIGFLSDVRRMNVGLTRAKDFLFIIARCKSIVVNPYWRELVKHAKETDSLVPVPVQRSANRGNGDSYEEFPSLTNLRASHAP